VLQQRADLHCARLGAFLGVAPQHVAQNRVGHGHEGKLRTAENDQ
jgi:hypothetical protein